MESLITLLDAVIADRETLRVLVIFLVALGIFYSA